MVTVRNFSLDTTKCCFRRPYFICYGVYDMILTLNKTNKFVYILTLYAPCIILQYI